MSCPPLETVERFAAGTLESAERALIESHMATCDGCRVQLADVRDNIRMADQIALARVDADAPPDTAARVEAAASPETAARTIADTQSPETKSGPSPRAPSGSISMSPGAAPLSIPGFEIVREISRGGQGVVYQAIQKSTKRKVAVKVLREGHFADSGERVRFEREVQILGQLKHPNIVAIHDSGMVEGHAYYVMDYISGQPLDEYVKAHSGTRSAKLETRSVLTLFAKICDAVHVAHLRGIIHRDLKPSNIRVDANGEPFMLDFGLAKITGAADAASPAMTVTGQFLGSLPWSSPEQAEGQPSKIDIRTDVYSLGVILYQLLTGRFPYEVVGTMRDVLDRIVSEEPAKPRTVRRQINDEVETIVLKCLAKERERRYQSAGEVASDIRRYLNADPIQAKSDSALYVLRKMARRHIAATVIVICLAVIYVSGIYLFFHYYRDAAAARAETDRLRVERANEQKDANSSIMVGMLGWCLEEWQAGRDPRRVLSWNTLPPFPVPDVAAFLVNEAAPPDQLLARLSPAHAALANFVIGERHLTAGRKDEARHAFEASLHCESKLPLLLRPLVDARLHQLGAPQAATRPAGGLKRARANSRP